MWLIGHWCGRSGNTPKIHTHYWLELSPVPSVPREVGPGVCPEKRTGFGGLGASLDPRYPAPLPPVPLPSLPRPFLLHPLRS